MSTDIHAVQSTFDEFRQELDSQNDRRERLIKASRDITNLSKKVIFLLHRIMNEDAADPSQQSKRASQSGMEKLRQVQALYAGMRTELQGEWFWCHHRSVFPGLQEYIEALSFAYYLEHGLLVTHTQVQQTLSDENGIPFFPLPVDDYLLGLSDLTGELMRLAISGITRKGGRDRAQKICTFVRQCKTDLDQFTPFFKELGKKQRVTAQSLEKIEDAVYAVVVRSSEYELPPQILGDIVSQSMSNPTGRTAKHQGARRDLISDCGHDDDDDDG